MGTETNGSQSASPADDSEDVTTGAAASTASDDNLDSSTGETGNGEQATGQDTETDETLHDVIGKALSGDEDEDRQKDDDEKGDRLSEEDGDSDKKEDPDDKDGKDGKSGQKEGEGEGEEDDETDENGKPLPFHRHPRFQKVIRQRNEYRDKVQNIEQERDQYRQGHEQFEAIQGFMQKNQLQVQDVSQALQIAAAINNDPTKAAEMLQPIVQQLQRHTGDLLPDDLKQRVESGELSEQDAKELVKTRNEYARLSQQSRRRDQQHVQAQREQALTEAREGMASAANSEQERIAAKDPDYAKKSSLVRDKLAVLIPQRQPKSPEEAAALVREAHQEVTKQLKGMVSRPEVRPGPSSTESGKSRTAPREPESMSEAIAQAMKQEV